MKKFKTLSDIINQLEKPNYKTADGIHDLGDNAAFVELKELDLISKSDIIDDLKSMSNNYLVCNESYVIPKSVIDMYIEYLESK